MQDTPEPNSSTTELVANTSESQVPDQHEEPTAKKHSHKLVWFFLIIQCLLIAALFAAGGYFYTVIFNQYKTDNIELQQQNSASSTQDLSSVKNELDRLSKNMKQLSSSTLSGLKTEMQATLKRFNSFEESVQKINRRLTDLSPKDEQQWMIAQIEYFLKMAQYRMTLTGDNHGAALLLDQAVVVAAQLRSPDAQALITAISNDRAHLKIEGQWQPELIHAQLNALIEKIPALSLQAYSQEDFKTTEQPDSLSAAGVNKILSKLVRVQKTDNAVKPLLDETTRKQVEQHIFMLLTESQLNVMRQNQEGFGSALQQLRVLVSKAFNQRQKETMFFLEEIDRLQEVRISKPSHTLDKSEQALRNLVQVFEKKRG